jgi:hypothetical protein
LVTGWNLVVGAIQHAESVSTLRFPIGKYRFIIVLAIIGLVMANFGLSLAEGGGSTLARLYLSPPAYLLSTGNQRFTLNIEVSDIVNLHRAELGLTYNSSLLEAESVLQGSFIPVGASSKFGYKISQSLGILLINVSFVNSGASASGNGIIASITFKGIEQADCCCSVLMLHQSLLTDPYGAGIDHDLGGAVYFWKSFQGDPSVGSIMDLYTPKGGRGISFNGGIFKVGETIDLLSRVTYNLYPVQNKLVAFEVIDPSNVPLLFMTAQTDADGIARMSFRTPPLSSSIGYWTCIAVVDVDNKILWDVTVLKVEQGQVTVGGYSLSINKGARHEYLDLCFIAVALSASLMFSILVFEKRRSRARRKE